MTERASQAGPRLDGTLLLLGERRLETRQGAFRLHHFHDLEAGRPMLVLARGELGGADPLLVRVHSACVTSEGLGACDCDCAEQLEVALAALAKEGRGALFYLMQEGRGAGFAAKARDRMWVQASGQRLTTFEAYERMGLPADHRRYGSVAHALRILGIRAPLRLLTNNPDKLQALEVEKLVIAEALPLHPGPQPFNLHYLASKSRSGHALPPTDAGHAAELPERVEAVVPAALPGARELVLLASYLLPVRLPGRREPVWFRLHLHLDSAEGRERIALTLGSHGERDAVEFVGRDVLLERFPLAASRTHKARWLAAASAMATRGAGRAVFLPTQLEATDCGPPLPDASARKLLDWSRSLGAGRG